LLFVPPLCFSAISSFIQCYLFYVHLCVKRCFHHFIPVAFIIIIHLIITALCVRTCIICVSYLFSSWV
jgi:hypothetical protein